MPSAPPPEGTEIPRYDSKTGIRLRSENRVIDLRDTDPINQALGQLDPILANVDTVLTNLGSLTGELDAALQGGGGGPVGGMLAGVQQSVAQLQGTITRVNTVIDDTAIQISALLEQVDDITGNLQETSEAFRDPTGLAATLLDPQGSLASILDDDNELYDRILTIIDNVEGSVSSLSESIAEVQGFTEYLNTTQPQISSLLEEGRATLNTGQDVLEGIRNNPLLRGGIPEEQEQQTTFQGIRDEEF
jgi:phospholipid/cholesterol/gamma-HCH transport system substrate-binding protein